MGLQLKSYRLDGDVRARFTQWPEHDNGFGFLNGGIITTVLDCHTAAVMMWEADRHGWPADPGAPVPFITAGLDVRFLRPTPLGTPLSLRAEATAVSESAITVSAELVHGEKVRATLVAEWLRFHPR